MTPAGKITLAWIDNSTRTYTADQAVQLCRDPRIAACIIGANCEDKELAGMLNRLLDDAGGRLAFPVKPLLRP